MKKSSFLYLFLIFSFLFSSCQSTPLIPTTAVPPTPTTDSLSGYLSQNLPTAPRLISSNPAAGQALSTSGAVTLVFDQPMDPATTAKALAVVDADQSAVSGALAWQNARTLVFHPQQPLKAGAAYQLRLGDSATSAQGQPIAQPLSISFQTAGDLQISQVFPADGAKDVENTATITVMFNRPVVPLVIAEQQAGLIDPIQFDPPVVGFGQWINTSLYVFHPDGVLKGGQTYQAVIKSGLMDASGDANAALKADMRWSFGVVAPSVSQVGLNEMNLESGRIYSPLAPVFTMLFRQPMDTRSVEANLKVAAAGSAALPLGFSWDLKNTMVTFKSSQQLQLSTTYTLSLDVSARAADGGSLAQGITRTFNTMGYPAIISTKPADQETAGQTTLAIAFAWPMDFKSLAGKVVFDPPIDVKTHSFYSSYNYIYSVYGLATSTRYTVHILPGMADPYGNAIQTEKVLTFTTLPARPNANLLMPYQPIYRVDGPQDFYLQYTNVDTVTSTLYSLTTAQFAAMMSISGKGAVAYAGIDKDKVWQDIQKPEVKQDQRVVKDLTMNAGGLPLAPGFYFLGMAASPVEYKGPFLDTRMLIVSTDNITLKVSPDQVLAWVTGLKSGQPVAGVHVRLLDSKFNPVGDGITDANGLFQLSLDPNLAASNDKNYYQSFYYAMLDEPNHFALASSVWGSGTSSSSFGPGEQYYRPWIPTTSYVYTERPLYRPGQPVYFKGIVRNDEDLAYSLPDQKQVQVTISSYKEQVYQETLPLSDIGTFDGTFNLDPEAALGSYSLQVTYPGNAQNGPILGSLNFDVAEYRRPEFQIDVQSDPANLLPGDAFNVALSASYYSGGGLSDADVDWTLRSEPYTFTPPSEYGAYSFSNAEYDNWDYYASRQEADHSGQIAAGQAKTGPDGKLTVLLKAQPASTQASQTLIFEATITDFSGSSVSGQAKVVMHTSAVYPGIRSKTYVGAVNRDQTFDLVALDWAGKPLAGSKVSVQIVERKWYSVQQEDDAGQLTWKTTVQENPAASFPDVQLDAKGLGSVTFNPSKGGIYRAIVTALDAHGNQNQSSAFIWVAGPNYVPWLQTNDRSFQLVADRASYTPGDTADLLIASPFQGDSYALVTIERGTLRKSEVLHLTANSTIYHLPITPDMAPNVYVSVIVVKGVDATNPRPNFRVGMARLKVDTNQQTLKVTLTADHAQAAPRDAVQYTVQTATLDGKPVPAEVSLSLTDLATLSLKDSTVPPLLDFFYAPRSLSVITAVAIVQSIEEYNANIADALQATNGSHAGSGGKGGGYAGVTEVRQDFPDTAYWQASVKTGADGKAVVTVTLPDNLTTWRMDARAVTADTRVGQSTFDLISSKPLLIRPQTPRFLVTGDVVTLGAAVHNNTDQALSVTVALDAAGVTLSDPKPQVVSILANSQSYVTWTATVPPESQRVDLVFSATGGGYTNSTLPTLGTLDNQGIPVYRYETPETVGTSGVLSDNGARAESVDLPPDMKVQTGQLKVELSPSLAAGMTDGLTYLTDYPYESTEAAVSRFLPNVRLSQALTAAGIQDAALAAGLKTQVNQDLQKIYSRQNADGGWGWWSEMQSDVLTTAYVALGLHEASAAGYTVNPATLSKALNFLRSNLKSFTVETPPEQLNRQAFVLYVLARAGAPEVSRSVQLYDLRQSMSLYARALLMQTLFKIDPKDARIKTLISDLTSAAILSAAGTHWEEKTPDYWNWNTDLRTTAIVLAALIETDPQNALNANAVRYLMVNRTNGRWLGTQETTWSLLALTDWVTATGELNPDYRYAAAFNGKQLAQGTATKDTVRDVKSLVVDVTQMLSSEANRLVFARDGSAGSLYYTAYLNLWLPVAQVKALDRGVVVSRQYFQPGDLTHPVTAAKQGDVLLVRLTVVAPNTLRYLLVTDPLPAGMEAVDRDLNGSPQAVQPDTYDWKRIGTDGWGWWFFSHIELRDQQVVLSTDVLPPGTYVYTYLVRASTPGSFNVLPPTAQEFYFPDVSGRGDGSTFTIK